MSIKNVFLPILLCFLMAGCASTTTVENTDIPTRILIINGEGLNTVYPDNPNASNFLAAVGQKYAEHLSDELKKLGANTQVYTKIDKTIGVKQVVSKQLSRSEQDGLIQISVIHTKNEQENAINLNANYLVIASTPNGDGKKTVSFKAGAEKQFSVLDQKTGAFNPTPVSEMAREFALMLKNNGLI